MCPLLQSRSQIAIPTAFVMVSGRRRNAGSGPACAILSVVHCHGAGNYCQRINTPGHPRFYPTPSHRHRAAPRCYTWHKSPGHRAWRRAPRSGHPVVIQEGSDSKQSSRAPPSLLDFGHDATPQWGEGAGFHHTPTQPHAFCPQPRGSSTPTAPAAPNTRSSQGCADLGSDPCVYFHNRAWKDAVCPSVTRDIQPASPPWSAPISREKTLAARSSTFAFSPCSPPWQNPSWI